MKISTLRGEVFSDAVIAIIITIMVLDLKPPEIAEDTTAQEMNNHIWRLIPRFIAYIFSFMMIGIFWNNHHHMFHLLEKSDERLLWQNLFFLFWISLIPFGTAMVGANPSLAISIALYGFILLMTTLSFAIMRSYTLKKDLIHSDEDEALTKKVYKVSIRSKTKNYIGAAAYLVSIPLAYVNIYFAYACFIIPPIIFFIPDGIDDEKMAERIEEKNG